MGIEHTTFYNEADFSSMQQEPNHTASIEEIEKGFYKNPMELCQLNGRSVTYKTAYYLVNYFKFKSKDIAKKLAGAGPSTLQNAPEEARIAVMDMLGLTEIHLANTVFDATMAEKKKYMVVDGEIHEKRDPDHSIRLQAVEVAAKWRGMNAAEKVEINNLANMNQEKVVELIREEKKKVIPGQYKVIANEIQKEEEKKEDNK